MPNEFYRAYMHNLSHHMHSFSGTVNQLPYDYIKLGVVYKFLLEQMFKIYSFEGSVRQNK